MCMLRMLVQAHDKSEKWASEAATVETLKHNLVRSKWLDDATLDSTQPISSEGVRGFLF